MLIFGLIVQLAVAVSCHAVSAHTEALDLLLPRQAAALLLPLPFNCVEAFPLERLCVLFVTYLVEIGRALYAAMTHFQRAKTETLCEEV